MSDVEYRMAMYSSSKIATSAIRHPQFEIRHSLTTQASILLIAPNGMLGRAWRELLDQRAIQYRAADRQTLDITNPAAVRKAIGDGDTLVINCAAWTDVDGAETHEAQAQAVNGAAVGALAQRCREVGATLVHYSTDYVFDGQATQPYRVDQPRHPINAYGRSKAAGEAAVEASGCDHLLIRTSWVYAPWGKNFVLTMAKLISERDTLRVVQDQVGRPTSAEHLAATTLALLDRQARGIFHITDGGQCSWYDFAVAIAAKVNPSCRIEPCTTAEFPRPAKRPAYSVLDITETEHILGPMPDWESAVNRSLTGLKGLGSSV